jgi:hypothetical protein
VTVGLRAVRESEAGSESGVGSSYGTRVWDQKVLSCWLPVLARSQRFLRIEGLSGVFDLIDWDTEYDEARARSRATGTPARQIVSDRVEAVLRDALREAAA